MSKVFSKVGVVEKDKGRIFVRTSSSDVGVVVYGPYEKLGKGRYSTKFIIEPAEFASRDLVCCKIDVVGDQGRKKLFEYKPSVGELRDNGNGLEVQFEMNGSGFVEYRVFALGTAGLRVAYERKASVILDENSDLSFLTTRSSAADNPVFRANYADISYLTGLGAEFLLEGEELRATVNDVKVGVDCKEDIQLISEIFLANSYTVLLPRRCVAIDIGMNVGMAALALASNPMIEQVYAFEPFKAPYNRALRNISLNPGLLSKITPHNFGLSDKDESMEVLSQDLNTIGVSVRGHAAGKKETIHLRDAGRELKGLVMDAKQSGLSVVIKVDCEGSEFPIFEAMARDDLFGDIDAFMIEWHKWWSKEKTQHDLIRPLVKANYFVFDRTKVESPNAGMLLAVRAMQS